MIWFWEWKRIAEYERSIVRKLMKENANLATDNKGLELKLSNANEEKLKLKKQVLSMRQR